MNTGIIKFFNTSKGFGFVTPDDGRPDVFLPAAAVTAAGVTSIKPGQRVTFEQAPDVKGPKVSLLKLVGDPPAKEAVESSGRVTVYCDANMDATADVIEAVRNGDFSVTIQDYVTVPPSVDQLKRLSQILSVSGQSLVRRYDPLFLALRLDDRFIHEQDFWTAIVEHPTLINGPVLASGDRARVCKTADDVRAFMRKDDAMKLAKPKTISPRIAAMLRGETLPDIVHTPVVETPAPVPSPLAEKAARTEIKAAIKPKATAKPKGKTPAKRPPAKAPAKKTVKKTAAKPDKTKKKK